MKFLGDVHYTFNSLAYMISVVMAMLSTEVLGIEGANQYIPSDQQQHG